MERPTKYMKLVIQIAKAKKSVFPPTEFNTSWLRLWWELRKITWLLRGCVDCFVSEYSLQFWFQEVPLIFRLQLKTNFINVFFRKQIIKQMVVKLSYRIKNVHWNPHTNSNAIKSFFRNSSHKSNWASQSSLSHFPLTKLTSPDTESKISQTQTL